MIESGVNMKTKEKLLRESSQKIEKVIFRHYKCF